CTPTAASSRSTAAVRSPDQLRLRTSNSMSAGDTISVTISGGAKICVPDSVTLITPYVLQEQEDWFEDEVRFVRRLLRPGMAVVDVGASFGIFTMTMASAVGA